MFSTERHWTLHKCFQLPRRRLCSFKALGEPLGRFGLAAVATAFRTLGCSERRGMQTLSAGTLFLSLNKPRGLI